MDKLQRYLLMTVLGYFGIKIFNGSVKMLPNKPAREEINDLVATVVLGAVLYVLNDMEGRTLMAQDTVGTMLYFAGFILGLTTPFIKKQFLDRHEASVYFTNILIVFVVLSTLYITFTSNYNDIMSSSGYLLYVFIVALIFLGVIFTKKDIKRYPTTDKKTQEKGTYESEGQTVNIGLGMIAFLVSLLFVVDSDNPVLNSMLVSLQGFFYGTFVSSVSLFGIEYILSDTDKRTCVGDACRVEGMIIDDKPYENLTSQVSTLKWILGLVVVHMLVTITLIYVEER